MKTRRICRQKIKSPTCTKCDEPRKAGHKLCEKHWQEWRKDYQNKYYETHKPQAKEYQRQYAREHKKKLRYEPTCHAPTQKFVKTVFTVQDLQSVTGDKLLKRLTKVLSGERGLARV